LQYFNYTLNNSWNNITTTGISTNAYGGVLTTTINTTGAGINDYAFITYQYMGADNTIHTFSFKWIISEGGTGTAQDLANNPYGLSLFDRVIIMFFTVLVFGGLAYQFGGANAAAAAIMFVFGYFTAIGFVSIWLTIPSLIILGFIMTGGIR
jgi:hypothetical protein